MKVLKLVGVVLTVALLFTAVTPAIQASQVEPAFLYEEGEKREPILAAVMSLFIPGLGQLYNGDTPKAYYFLGAFGAGILLSVVGIGLLIIPVAAVWAAYDAYVTAVSINEALGLE